MKILFHKASAREIEAGFTGFVRKWKISCCKLDEKAVKCKPLGNDEHCLSYLVQDLQTKTTFVARVLISKESEIVFVKLDSEVGLNYFPDIEELNLRQNPIGTEVRQQIIDIQTVPSDQVTNHESVLHQLKRENESREGDSEAK